jgi:ribonuclease T2
MKAVTRLSVSALLALLSLGSLALARHADPARSDGGRPGQFDYYLLTLSWSPTYCLIHPHNRAECSGKGYGFVLHGLWPQYDSGGYPQDCVPEAPLPTEAEAVGRTLFPSPTLVRHEWQRHGTCTGLDALTYFRTADRALAVVRIPATLEAPQSDLNLSAEQIASQIQAVNAGMPSTGLKIACSRGELAQVRVCLNRDLTFRSCGRRVRNSCPPQGAVRIPSAR